MKENAQPFFLFPHMSLPENDLRHLSILLPRLSVLQVIGPPAIPEWSRKQISAYPSILQQETLDMVKLCLKGFQEFAAIHGENSTLASISHEYILGDLRESRFQIQSKLRGKATSDLDLERRLLVEAAVFLEMARELDEKETELDSGLSRVDHLEDEFREILGITDEEELQDVLETANPPLVSQKNAISFMLPKRIGCWLRLFLLQSLKIPPVFVMTGEQVFEELLEPLEAEYDQAGKSLILSRARLASIPTLSHLPRESFLSLVRELSGSDVLDSYLRSLEGFLGSPGDSAIREELDARNEALRTHLEDFCAKAQSPAPNRVDLMLLSIEDCTLEEIWTTFDRDGYEVLGEAIQAHEPPTTLLYLKG